MSFGSTPGPPVIDSTPVRIAPEDPLVNDPFNVRPSASRRSLRVDPVRLDTGLSIPRIGGNGAQGLSVIGGTP